MDSSHPDHPQHLDHLAVLLRSHEALKASTDALHDHLKRSCTPAEIRPLTLTAARPITTDLGGNCLSIGVLNPTLTPVYLGIGGATAAPGAGAVSAPPKSLLVLPVPCGTLDVGGDPAILAGGDATVFLLRFATVQAAFLGASQ